MATTNIRTLAELREDIKVEARVKGSDNLDSWIDSLVNEILTSALQNKRYFEMLVLNEEIPTVAETDAYDLPDDFMAIRAVRYVTASGSSRSLNDKNHYVQIPRGRSPRYYEVIGENSIIISPILDMPDDDTISIDYYRYPETLTEEDEIPVPKLIAHIKQKAIARTLNYNKELQEMALLQTEAGVNEARGHVAENG